MGARRDTVRAPRRTRLSHTHADERTHCTHVRMLLRRYVLLLDAHPFGGETPQDVYAEAVRGEPFFPQRVLPPTARDLISALLARSPSDRPEAAAVWGSGFFRAGAFIGAEDLRADAVRSGLIRCGERSLVVRALSCRQVPERRELDGVRRVQPCLILPDTRR